MARPNTNKAYEALMARREQPLLQEKQQRLMGEMDELQARLAAATKGTPEYKALLKAGRAKLQEMKDAGIEIQFS